MHAHAPDAIRKSLYSFSRLPGKMKITDLGNLKTGTSFEDTLAGLRDVLIQLLAAGYCSRDHRRHQRPDAGH
ncbi:MAG: hypothetical protein MZV63_47785 [Marinilabiliales bacterium]|nr:hypothetical protein [Marinilabiliales bacterium]